MESFVRGRSGVTCVESVAVSTMLGKPSARNGSSMATVHAKLYHYWSLWAAALFRIKCWSVNIAPHCELLYQTFYSHPRTDFVRLEREKEIQSGNINSTKTEKVLEESLASRTFQY